MLLCGSALLDWTASTRRTDKRHPAPRCPQAPTVPPRGTMGTTPSEAATARPADSTTPRARKGTMYVISSILLPHPHPPPPTPAVSTTVYKWVLSCSFVLVDMNSHTERFCSFVLLSVISRTIFIINIIIFDVQKTPLSCVKLAAPAALFLALFDPSAILFFCLFLFPGNRGREQRQPRF